MSSFIRGAAGAALCCLAAAAPAHAAGIVYADKGNVWVATPDGSVNRALTTDGTADTPSYDQAPQGELVGPYNFPSADDTGRIISTRYRYGDGTGNFFWKFIGPDGAHIASNIVSMYQCGSATGPLGPFDARISRDGGYVAFSFFCGARYVGLNPTQTWLQDTPSWSGERVSWAGTQLVAGRSGTAYAQQADGAPLTDSWSPWIGGDADETIGRVEVARGGGRMLIESTVGETQSLVFGTFEGGVPSETGAVRCKVPTAPARKDAVDDPESFFATWSPDGSMFAWSDSEGVKVAAVPDLTAPQNGEGQTCSLPSPPRVLSATGETPSFTAYTWASPSTGGGGTAPGGGTTPGGGDGGTSGDPTQPAAAGALSGTLPASVKAAALAKGVRLRLTVPGAGRLVATATVPRSLAKRLGVKGTRVASGSAAPSARGSATVKLRLATKVRRRANRLRGKRVALKVVFIPPVGAPSSVQRTVKVR